VVPAKRFIFGGLLEKNRTIRLMHVGMSGDKEIEIGRAFDINGQQMAGSRFTGAIERANTANQGGREIVDPSVLIEMLAPGNDEEHLAEAAGVGRIAI
jgi:hypothetical protein